MANKHIQHVKSNVVNEGNPKLPTASQLLVGEIAINYANGHERMSIKNDSDEIVEFVSKDYIANDLKEVQIGTTTPTKPSVDLFVDTSVNPETVDVYTKTEINGKVTALEQADSGLDTKIEDMILIGANPTAEDSTEIIIDTSESPTYEVYTKAQVDSIFQKLITLNPGLNWE